MKRLFCMIIAVCCVFLTGCAKEEEKIDQNQLTQNLSKSFVTTADIQYKDITAQLKIDQKSPGDYEVEFLAPETMAGMKIKTKGDIITLSYKGLDYTLTSQEFFNSSVAKMLVSTINQTASQEGITAHLSDGMLMISGTVEAGEFTLCIDPKEGNLLNLEIPGAELSAQFKDFAFLS